jgi:hypothetical protein
VSIGDEAVVIQNACLPSILGPLPSNKVYFGVPPTTKQWTFPSSLKVHATLNLSYGMVFCFNVVVLLQVLALSLLPLAAVMTAIHTLPMGISQNLAATAGACNSPAYADAYRFTSYKMRELVASNDAAWCDAQVDGCSISIGHIVSRVLRQVDPARTVRVAQRTIVPCQTDNCAHFDDDVPEELPRCIANATRTGWCPEVLLFMRNATVGVGGAQPPCVMDVLVECTQQAVVAALDWVPTGDLVPPPVCARRIARELLTTFSWRAPLETLRNCIRLMLANLAFYIAFICTAIVLKKQTLGRFQSGAWDVWDVRSQEWKRQVAGHLLKSIGDADFTLSAALNGSKWRVILYRLFGMRAGKQVFMDRDVVIMGARAPIHNVPAQQVAALPNSLVPPAALAR